MPEEQPEDGEQQEPSGQSVPPPAAGQPPQQPPGQDRSRQYWTGLTWGAIPLVIFLLTGAIFRFLPDSVNVTAGFVGLLIGVVAYLVALIFAIVYLFRRDRRFIGYGLLTIVLITPVVAVYGCMVIVQIGRSAPG